MKPQTIVVIGDDNNVGNVDEANCDAGIVNRVDLSSVENQSLTKNSNLELRQPLASGGYFLKLFP